MWVPMKVKVKVAHSCPTLCDPMDYTVHGILQARILEWVAHSALNTLFLYHFYLYPFELGAHLQGASSASGKGHEEGGLAYAKAVSSLSSLTGNSRAIYPQNQSLPTFCFVLSPTPLTLRGAVPHYLSEKS